MLKPAFQAACRAAIEALARETADGGPALLIGTPWVEDGKLYNAYCLLDGGAIAAVRFKVDLPNYGVFDEKRVFAPGPMPGPVNFRGVRLGVPICEDIWGAEVVEMPGRDRRRTADRAERLALLARQGRRPAQHRGRARHRERPAADLRQPGRRPGRAGVRRRVVRRCMPTARSRSSLPAFRETVVTTRWQRSGNTWRCVGGPVAQLEATATQADYAACVLGLRDYVDKNGFKGVVLGLSGGIDSALCAAMAVDALGAERVRCVMLPYRFTSQESLDDAAAVAKALGVHIRRGADRERGAGSRGRRLRRCSPALPRDVTEENLQARARGTILMAISNKFGLMVVTTGNKSEMSVGYATLYGDMNGGFNPIKDLYKTEVYRLARLRNRWKPDGALGPDGAVIPENIITEPPTAELRENQKDQDSLPPYDVLDAILRAAGRARGAGRDDRRRGLRPRDRDAGRRACSISPNTSAGRRRRA